MEDPYRHGVEMRPKYRIAWLATDRTAEVHLSAIHAHAFSK